MLHHQKWIVSADQSAFQMRIADDDQILSLLSPDTNPIDSTLWSLRHHCEPFEAFSSEQMDLSTTYHAVL